VRRRVSVVWAHNSPLLVDAGPLYAYIDADDRHHGACRGRFACDLAAANPGEQHDQTGDLAGALPWG
jgi:hypothetical protein